jgi:nucleoside-diphosphate-sugar epimerase
MKIAITGGSGFIGRKLVSRHLSQGDELRVFSRRAPGESDDSRGLLKRYQGDLLTYEELESFVDGVDVLYHCAGEIRDENRMKTLHVDATQRLIKAATGRIGRWVQLSSVGAYGKIIEGSVNEQTELNPSGMYEITKVDSDDLVSRAARDGAFECVVLRPSNVYGADMSNQSLYSFIEMIRRGWFFFIGEPGASANYIHVGNVVEGLLRCGMQDAARGQIYNLSDQRTMEQFVATIAKTLGKTMPVLRLPEWPVRQSAKLLGNIKSFPLTVARVDALTGRAIYAIDKIEKELNYRHIVSMEAGLIEITEFWQSRFRK